MAAYNSTVEGLQDQAEDAFDDCADAADDVSGGACGAGLQLTTAFMMQQSGQQATPKPTPPFDPDKAVKVGTSSTNTGQKVDLFEVKTPQGTTIRCWALQPGQPAPSGIDPTHYCHGLTLGATDNTEKKYSTLPEEVPKILKEQYDKIDPKDAKKGDILVYKDKTTKKVDHSAKLTDVGIDSKTKGFDPDKTKLDTKNGMNKEKNDSLKGVNGVYPGRDVEVYKPKATPPAPSP